MTKSRTAFFLGVIISLLGAVTVLVPILPNHWPYVLIVLGLVLVNAGLFGMGQPSSREWS